jgi:Spy/CpxP family protein refolding chaperone
MSRLRILVPGLAVLILACGLLHGDDPKPDPKPAGSGKKMSLPAKWSKLGLSEEQKQKVRTIRGDYASRIEVLRLQIAKLQKEEKAELFKLLTEGQKKRLRELASDETPTEDKPTTGKSGGQ